MEVKMSTQGFMARIMIAILFAALLAGCNLPWQSEPPVATAPPQTEGDAALATIEAIVTETAKALELTLTQMAPTPTPTSEAGEKAAPTATPTETPIVEVPTSTPVAPAGGDGGEGGGSAESAEGKGGAEAALPTPIPLPPTPSSAPQYAFAVTNVNIHTCGGVDTAIYRILNTGGASLRSVELLIQNLTSGVDVYGPTQLNRPFLGSDRTCKPISGRINPGYIGYVAGSIGDSVPGDLLRARITLCTRNDLGGKCYTEYVDIYNP